MNKKKWNETCFFLIFRMTVGYFRNEWREKRHGPNPDRCNGSKHEMKWKSIEVRNDVAEESFSERKIQKEIKSAVTRIRTWVTAATTQGPNH